MSFYSEIEASLISLEEKHLKRSPRLINGPHSSKIFVDGRSLLCFCSNNYLGLANHPSILSASSETLSCCGFGSASSRLICGTMELHRRLEERISRFLGFESALFFSSGYAANVGVIQSLFDSSDVIFSDSLNHASLIDGCRLSRARVFVFRHLDSSHLLSLLSQNRSLGKKALVVTESVFSMDGDSSPLDELRSLCDSYDAALMVDEAHSLGVFGDRGVGFCLSRGVIPDIFIGTFGKAFGTYGSFVASSSKVVQLIENRARSFVYSTSPPAILAAAALASTDLVEYADVLRSRLFAHASLLRRSLVDMGYQIPDVSSPIIPVFFGDPKRVVDFSSALFDLGFLVQGIRPPSVPANSSRLRLIPIATHTDDHIASLLEAFRTLLPLYNFG